MSPRVKTYLRSLSDPLLKALQEQAHNVGMVKTSAGIITKAEITGEVIDRLFVAPFKDYGKWMAWWDDCPRPGHYDATVCVFRV